MESGNKNIRRNIRLIFQYDGTRYSGFQRQKNLPTIQGELENAIKIITKSHSHVISSGRTDAGVHALAQVANFKTHATIPAKKFVPALNSVLPNDIRIINAKDVPWEFHARFDAIWKTYEYSIDTRPIQSVFTRNFTWHLNLPLNINKMKEAANHLVGVHDFRSFASSGGNVKTFTRNVKRLEILSHTEPIIKIRIEADGFLYNMVRTIVGTLLEVGLGKITSEDVKYIRDAKDRRCAGPKVPAHGLCLIRVVYAEPNCSKSSVNSL